MTSQDEYPRLRYLDEGGGVEDGQWIASFCGCCADPCSCLLAMCCPCVAVGMIAEKLDGGATHWLAGALVWFVLQDLTTLGCLYSCHYRRKLRRRFNLPSRPLPDALVHWICFPCALCQELREIKARETTYYGFTDTTVAPPGRQFMGRA